MKRLQLFLVAHYDGAAVLTLASMIIRLFQNFHQCAKSCKHFIRSDLPMHTVFNYSNYNETQMALTWSPFSIQCPAGSAMHML